MEEITYSHIPIATLITAFLLLAPIFEWVGYRKGDLRYDRLAKSMVFFVMILYAPGAALGTGIPMFIMGLYPEFWSRFANLFFWPLIAQFVFFLLDLIFLFFLYYLTWERMMNRKPLHIFFGFMTAFFGLLIHAVWDGLGSYMMTPGRDLPMVNEAVGWSAAALFNPTYPFLFLHRFFGNISYSMLLTGGVLALKYMRCKDPEEKEYFGFATDLTFAIGFVTFFAMPFIGWGYAAAIQGNAPVVFHAVMGGHVSPHFTIKMILVGIFLVLGGTYLFVRHPQKVLPLALSAGILSLYLVLHWHPPLDWLGGDPLVWRITYTLLLAGFLIFLWMMRNRRKLTTQAPWPWTLFVAGLAAFFAFALGGFVRSRGRSPYSVYKQIEKPEVTAREADRFLLYDKCLICHPQGPNVFSRYETRDWEQRVDRERERPGADISDEEAARIVRVLQELYP